MMILKLLKASLLLFLFATVVVFIFQNMMLVEISFLKYHIEIPIALATGAFYIFGAISGGLIFSLIIKLIKIDSKST